MLPGVVLLASVLSVVNPEGRPLESKKGGSGEKVDKARGTVRAPATAAENRGGQGPWVAVAVGPGFSFAQGPVWLRAQARVGLPLMRLSDRLDLQVVVPVGFGWTRSAGAFSSTSTAYGLDLVPLMRLGLNGPARLRFYGDVGVGVVHYRYRFELPSVGSADGSSTGLGIRVGAGVEYAMTPQVALFFEPIHLLFQTAQEGTFRFGNTSYSSSTGAGTQAQLAAGAQLRF